MPVEASRPRIVRWSGLTHLGSAAASRGRTAFSKPESTNCEVRWCLPPLDCAGGGASGVIVPGIVASWSGVAGGTRARGGLFGAGLRGRARVRVGARKANPEGAMPRGAEARDELARELCACCRRMARAGLIAGRAGNLSLRDGDTVLVTPR